MTEESTLPWDRPGRLLVDRETFLANLVRLGYREPYLDARSMLMELLIRALPQELKRHGVGGLVTVSPGASWVSDLKMEGWDIVTAPPAHSGHIATACRCGVVVTIGQVGEAVLASNQAQGHHQAVDVLVRVRSDDLMADHGPGAPLAILEILPTLPALRLRGFFLEAPFSSPARRQQFLRAVQGVVPDLRTPMFLGTGSETPDGSFRRLIGHEPLEFCPERQLMPAVTLQARGFPVAVNGRRILLEVDLGHEHGILDSQASVLVEDVPGFIHSVQLRKSVIEIPERPGRGTPWTVTLVGAGEGQVLTSLDGSFPRAPIEWSRLAGAIPVILQDDGVDRNLS